MQYFLPFMGKLAPLYFFAFLGFAASHWLKVDRRTLAVLIFYIFTPLVIGIGTARAQFSFSLLYLPVITFCIAGLMTALYYTIAKRFWHDGTPNIMGLMAATGNMGYFGLPVALLLFDADTVAKYIAGILGTTLFESSIGFFVVARGSCTTREVLRKILVLPSLYAFIIGCIISSLHITLPDAISGYLLPIQGCYTVIGMMLAGGGLATMRGAIDWPFTALAISSRFVAWPLGVSALIALDHAWLQILGRPEQQVLYLMSIVPLPANSIVLATLFGLHPDKVAFAVILSTLIAVLYVPCMAMLFLM